MKFYEKHAWARSVLSAVASRDGDQWNRDFVINILPALLYVAVWIVVIWTLTMSPFWTFSVLLAASLLTFGWYVFHKYASEVFDPDDFEHPTPQ